MEKLFIGEINFSKLFENIGVYFHENWLIIALIFITILFGIYFILYLKKSDEAFYLKYLLDEERNYYKKNLKLLGMMTDDYKNKFNSLEKLHYTYINRLTTKVAYYKKKFLVLDLAIKENFGNNKAIKNLLKEDIKELMKKKTSELIKK